MIRSYKDIHAQFKLDRLQFTTASLKTHAFQLSIEVDPFQKELGLFLLDWLDDRSFIETHTSGSTGKPKSIQLSKQAMLNSAVATGKFFNLKPGQLACLCLPVSYIAGKMMLVRALVLGLELDILKPQSLLDFDSDVIYDFAAMVPMQLDTNLSQMQHIKTLIVGGAPLSPQLVLKAQAIKTKIYETYGMTETVSHIAVKAINDEWHVKSNEPSYFSCLPDISVSQDDRGCLVVHAPKITDDMVVTNDVVSLKSPNQFCWLGRWDHVINSGGIKIHPEQVEAKLQDKIKHRFFIASQPDTRLGDTVILIVEAENYKASDTLFEGLDAFEKPKSVYALKAFIQTNSGKIQRKKTIALVKK